MCPSRSLNRSIRPKGTRISDDRGRKLLASSRRWPLSRGPTSRRPVTSIRGVSAGRASEPGARPPFAAASPSFTGVSGPFGAGGASAGPVTSGIGAFWWPVSEWRVRGRAAWLLLGLGMSVLSGGFPSGVLPPEAGNRRSAKLGDSLRGRGPRRAARTGTAAGPSAVSGGSGPFPAIRPEGCRERPGSPAMPEGWGTGQFPQRFW